MLRFLKRYISLATVTGCALVLACGIGMADIVEAQSPAPDAGSFVMGQSATLLAPFTCWQIKLYEEALAGLGYILLLRDAPLVRAATLTENGNIDGVMSRSARFGELHPKMVRVQEPNCIMRFIAVTRLPDANFNDIKALAGSSHSVAYLRGDEMTQVAMKTSAPEVRTFIVNSPRSGFRMLLADRVQIFIAPEPTASILLNDSDFRDTGDAAMPVSSSPRPSMPTSTRATLNWPTKFQQPSRA